MPRYFFHVYDGAVQRDDEGSELPDLAAAREEAMATAAEVLGSAESLFQGSGAWRMEVTDQSGEVVCRLNVTASVT